MRGGGKGNSRARFAWRPLLPVNLNTALQTEPREVRNAGDSGTQTTPPHFDSRRFFGVRSVCLHANHRCSGSWRQFWIFVNKLSKVIDSRDSAISLRESDD